MELIENGLKFKNEMRIVSLWCYFICRFPRRVEGKCDYQLLKSMLLALSYLMHTVKQLVDDNGCYTGINVGHGIGNDQIVVMN